MVNRALPDVNIDTVIATLAGRPYDMGEIL